MCGVTRPFKLWLGRGTDLHTRAHSQLPLLACVCCDCCRRCQHGQSLHRQGIQCGTRDRHPQTGQVRWQTAVIMGLATLLYSAVTATQQQSWRVTGDQGAVAWLLGVHVLKRMVGATPAAHAYLQVQSVCMCM